MKDEEFEILNDLLDTQLDKADINEIKEIIWAEHFRVREEELVNLKELYRSISWASHALSKHLNLSPKEIYETLIKLGK